MPFIDGFFPMLIAVLVPVRIYALPHLFGDAYVKAMDGNVIEPNDGDVEEVITLCKELDVLGVPMRYRLGLRFDRDSDDWALLGNRVHIASCAARHLLFPRFASILSRRCSL